MSRFRDQLDDDKQHVALHHWPIGAACDCVLQKIWRDGDMSFAGLERYLDQLGIGVEGDYDLHMGSDKHLLLYYGMSAEFVEVAERVRKDPSVFLRPCEFLVYLIDGGKVRVGLPIAKRSPKDGYKSDHWIPAIFEPVTAEEQPKLERMHGRWPLPWHESHDSLVK